MPTWDAEQYLRFDDERTRPCRELAARVAVVVPDRVIDLGCGPGNSTAVLAERWPNSELTGLDSSSEMIAVARRADPRLARNCVGDIAGWANENGQNYDIVFNKRRSAMEWTITRRYSPTS